MAGVVACLTPRKFKLTKPNLPTIVSAFYRSFGMWFRRTLFYNLEQNFSEVARGERCLLPAYNLA